MIKRTEKKGELTNEQIIAIVILVVGFAVILYFFFYRGAIGQEPDRQTCHLSVIERGSLPNTAGIKDLPPLKCSTRKICVTDKLIGKGNCSDELGSTYDTVRVSSSKDKIGNEINQFVADEQAACWNTMGAGNAQLFTRDTFTKKRCIVCSRISFDGSIQKNLPVVDGLGKFMISKYVPNSNITYWNYLSGGIVPEQYNSRYDNFTTSEKAILYMESDTSNFADWIPRSGFAAGCIIGGVKGAVVGVIGGAIGCIAGGTVGTLAGGATEVEIKSLIGYKPYVSEHVLIDYGENMKDLGCDSLESIP